MAYTAKERLRINLHAKRKVGKIDKSDAQDKFTFMQQCISELMDQSEADDETDAEQICQLMWEEGDDSWD